jgi:ABC-2 type transport system ATP-binding protein
MSSGDGTPRLRAVGIERGYGRRSVLRGVDVRIDAGEVVALLGPNGAGKTTLMKVLVGLLTPTRGTVDGPTGTRVGWVPQGGATYARLTVRENLELFARLLGLAGSPRAQALDAIERGDLQPWTDSPGADLSGGLRQRLNVAVGLLGDPELLVLDEPTTGVDLVHRTAMFRVLRDRADAGTSVLYSTHSLEDASYADRVVVVVGGEVAYDGTLEGIAVDEAAAAAHAGGGHLAQLDAVSLGLLRLWEGGPS